MIFTVLKHTLLFAKHFFEKIKLVLTFSHNSPSSTLHNKGSGPTIQAGRDININTYTVHYERIRILNKAKANLEYNTSKHTPFRVKGIHELLESSEQVGLTQNDATQFRHYVQWAEQCNNRKGNSKTGCNPWIKGQRTQLIAIVAALIDSNKNLEKRRNIG